MLQRGRRSAHCFQHPRKSRSVSGDVERQGSGSTSGRFPRVLATLYAVQRMQPMLAGAPSGAIPIPNRRFWAEHIAGRCPYVDRVVAAKMTCPIQQIHGPGVQHSLLNKRARYRELA